MPKKRELVQEQRFIDCIIRFTKLMLYLRKETPFLKSIVKFIFLILFRGLSKTSRFEVNGNGGIFSNEWDNS